MTAELIPARLGHVLLLAGEPKREAADFFRASRAAKALRVDGKVVAAYGLRGSLLSPETAIWILASPAVRRHCREFLAACRAEFGMLRAQGARLVADVEGDNAVGIRFLRHWGFDVGPIREGRRRAVLAPRVGAPPGPPFIVYGLPRSRTRWLAEFLTYGGWTCHHQATIAMRGIADLAAVFRAPCTGSAEPGASLGWRLLRHHVPETRIVVVRRPVEECVASMCRVDLRGTGRYEPDILRRALTREDRALDEIAAQPDVLSVAFADLGGEEACRRIFERCLPFAFDWVWWASLRDRNIQCDAAAMLAYYRKHLDGVTGFKRACWAELRRLAYDGVARA